jgi:hypothetical protein
LLKRLMLDTRYLLLRYKVGPSKSLHWSNLA